MIQAQTLAGLLEHNARLTQHVGYFEGDDQERRVSYADLHRRALGILRHLQDMGAARGDRLILFLNNNEAFMDGFWAGMAGGIVPVPVAVGISDEHRHKLLRIARRLGDPWLYTDRKTLDRLAAFADTCGEAALGQRLRSRAFLIDQLEDVSRPGRPASPRPEDPAFIQFSSGSTSEPKGVVLTHANILANARGATEAARFGAADVPLSWMPLTHDMGLIGFFIMMFANGMQLNIMPTDLFIRRPLLWTALAARKKATLLSSPNFGFRHYLKVLGDRPAPADDLSSVRYIFNGAEPINVALCDEFLERMRPTGLKRSAMFPVYGLAEASLAVSFPAPGSEYRVLVLDRASLAVGQPAREAPRGSPGAVEFICEGRAIPRCELRVVDDSDAKLPERHVGHVHIRGENVTRGYFEAPEVNAASFTADGWLRTGDLGLVDQGELVITGRAKEIIFVNGQNYYPHDIESIAQQASGLELGKVAAAGCRPAGAETDELTLFVLHRGSLEDFVPVAAEVTRLVNEHAGLEVSHVVPVKRIPKTTSGKVQRVALEESFLAGEFATELAELARLREAVHAHAHDPAGGLERRLKAIVDDAMPGKRIEVDDNLFEIGASSLTLIQIHEQIDREFPGLVDLTELFDYPTVAQLSRHLQSKLAAGSS
ncbi:MAG: non-ribosomal peptide synthetase [Steroidobacteraceae bacterium]|jgi:acyl-CoA synthetase (AMP-forming)/AMP-acid ligase II|nr:non-ribosomal peptide synthetase [Steroidobacteraceae bacterium]